MDNGVFLNQMRRAFLKDELYGIFRRTPFGWRKVQYGNLYITFGIY